MNSEHTGKLTRLIQIRDWADRSTVSRERWQKKTAYFQAMDHAYLKFLVPKSSRVLALGCGIGSALAALDPRIGVGVDISEKKIRKTSNVKWFCNSAEKLPFKKNYFDYYTISFGIRNVNNIDNALKEAYRVLKPGGRFLCLEFSKVKNETLNRFYKIYSQSIPQIGKFIVGKSEPYKYLIDSIEKFDSQDEFFKKIKKQKFTNISYKNLSGGIVAIHSAWKV